MTGTSTEPDEAENERHREKARKHKAARDKIMRNRCIQPLDFGGGALGMLYEVAHLANLLLHVIQRTGGIEFDNAQPFFFQ